MDEIRASRDVSGLLAGDELRDVLGRLEKNSVASLAPSSLVEGIPAAALTQFAAQRAAATLLSREVRPPPGLLQTSTAAHPSSTVEETSLFVPRPSTTAGASSAELLACFNGLTVPPFNLRAERARRLEVAIGNRRAELEALPPDLPNETRILALLESRALSLVGLQRHARREVAIERRLLRLAQGGPRELLDWRMMRHARVSLTPQEPTLARPVIPAEARLASSVRPLQMDTPLYLEQLRAKLRSIGEGDSAALEAAAAAVVAEERRRAAQAGDIHKAEVEARTRVVMERRRWLAVLLTHGRRLRDAGATRRRRAHAEGVTAWHAKERVRQGRVERMRLSALKSEDHEAYLKLVQESKNERLTTLLAKTDNLLLQLGAMVQLQKDTERAEEAAAARVAAENAALAAAAAAAAADGSQATAAAGSARAPAPPARSIKAVAAAAVSAAAAATAGAAGGPSGEVLQGRKAFAAAIRSKGVEEERVTQQPSLLVAGQLRDYQVRGLQWMLGLYNNNLNGILADEMGLGKTIQTIALVCHLLEHKGNRGPHLILAPKAVLSNWANEFKRWAPSVPIVMYDGSMDARREIRAERGIHSGAKQPWVVLLTHYDIVMKDKAVLQKVAWAYMIVDEGHRLKNHESKLAAVIQSSYKVKRRLLLTGTPIQNSLTELWALLNFLLPTVFSSADSFEQWFSAPFQGTNAAADATLTEEESLLVIDRLHSVIRPFLLRRKKADVEASLPNKFKVLVKCEMSAWQKAYYRQLMENRNISIDGAGGRKKGMMNLMMQLRKCCNHPYLFLDDDGFSFAADPEAVVRASGKFALLDRMLGKLRASGHRVLLFSQMTRVLDIMQTYLNRRGYAHLRLDGATKGEEREPMLKAFNAPESPYFLFLLSTRAGGLGLNLQTADTVIMFDSDWNPQMDNQAEDRAHRIGQKREVRVFVLACAGSIEENILERASMKRGIDQKVIEAGQFSHKETSAEDRRGVLQDILSKASGGDVLAAVTPSDSEVNRMLARDDAEFALFESMDAQGTAALAGRPRLMAEDELPAWVTAEAPQKPESEEEDLAPGERRSRKAKRGVSYTPLTDAQFNAAIGDGEEDAPSPAHKRRRGQRASPEPGGDDDDDGPPIKRRRRQASSPSPSPSPSLQGRSARGDGNAEGEEDPPPPARAPPQRIRFKQPAPTT